MRVVSLAGHGMHTWEGVPEWHTIGPTPWHVTCGFEQTGPVTDVQ